MMACIKLLFLISLHALPLLFVSGTVFDEPGLNLTTTTEGNLVSLKDNSGQQPSTQWMLPNTASRIFVWVIGFIALIGNTSVLIWRCAGKSTENLVQIRLIANLAASDLLMSIYMITIASADMYFNQGFSLEADSWNSGIVCKLASILSVFAGEASMFFITLISIDRFIAVGYIYPLCRRLRLSKAVINISSVFIWIFAIALAVVPNLVLTTPEIQSDICIKLPLIKAPDFQPNASQVPYSTATSHILLTDNMTISSHPADIIEDPMSMSMYFLISVYLGLNSLCLLTVVVCYVNIFYIVWRSSHKLGISRATTEIRLCLRMGLLVATNFITWMPIVVTGILVQLDFIHISQNAYIFIIIFLLPINSAVNPYLYTFSIKLMDYLDHRHYKQAKRRATLPSAV